MNLKFGASNIMLAIIIQKIHSSKMKGNLLFMFFNLKINGNRLIKFAYIIMLLVILIIFSFGIYNIFFKEISSSENDSLTLKDTIDTNQVFNVSADNYTSILQAVHNNIDSYIGCKVHFSGYVYRLLDFTPNQFVLARDMIVNENPLQSLVVGFLCEYKNASGFKDGEWVDITGIIQKSDYYGEIAIIEVTNMFTCDEPKNKYVSTPDETYIPTNNLIY